MEAKLTCPLAQVLPKLQKHKVLEIETGHKTFEMKAKSTLELNNWHLRLQEVIMLHEKVANVAHGWLLKEEFAPSEGGKAAEKSQLKHYWFVLFSNGILMYFSDPNRAVLGQALGFIPVHTIGRYREIWGDIGRHRQM